MKQIIEQFGPDAEAMLFKAVIVLLLGITMLFVHSRSFKFLMNKSTIFLSMMLPVTIMLLTQTIATNLYLSLGLIGALSIVRYRTPVKSQYELAYLFALIAIGVIGGVSIPHACLLVLIMCLLPPAFSLVCIIWPSLNSEELRYNSNGKCEVNMVIDIADFESIDVNPRTGRVIRFDANYENNEGFVLINFETMQTAKSFRQDLKFKPKSISLANS